MEADWDEITRIAVPSSGLHAIPTPASAVVFDDQQELLWVGNDQVCDVRIAKLAYSKLTQDTPGTSHIFLWPGTATLCLGQSSSGRRSSQTTPRPRQRHCVTLSL